jgi:hypothetical protein
MDLYCPSCAFPKDNDFSEVLRLRARVKELEASSDKETQEDSPMHSKKLKELSSSYNKAMEFIRITDMSDKYRIYCSKDDRK